jgi:hypothetical protein
VLYNIFFGMRSLFILSMCPAHCNLFSFIITEISGSLYNLYNSFLYLILHISFSFIVHKFVLRFSFRRNWWLIPLSYLTTTSIVKHQSYHCFIYFNFIDSVYILWSKYW